MAKSGRTLGLRALSTNPVPVGQATNTGIPALSGTTATGAAYGLTPAGPNYPAGAYIDSTGTVRNADGSRLVSAKTAAKRGASWWSQTSTTTKVLIIGGGVAAVLVFIAYRKATAPARYANRVVNAVKGVGAAVKGA